MLHQFKGGTISFSVELPAFGFVLRNAALAVKSGGPTWLFPSGMPWRDVLFPG